VNVFAEMTMNAVANKAVNLGQGFPAFGAPKFIGESLKEIIPGDEWIYDVP
jgi:aspartate/methionine/tyrosine aminotransferase